ncbi:putative sialidase-like protein [Ceratocystis lukuohia]|uniref:Sialidase-like protein n=1 Tax=Ceratocystis lukuohia TaxID=2019550 RepID=A0ABR4MK65_9PEZI
MSTMSPLFDMSFYDIAPQDFLSNSFSTPSTSTSMPLPLTSNSYLETPLFDFPSRHARSNSHCSTYSIASAVSNYSAIASTEDSCVATALNSVSPVVKKQNLRQSSRQEAPATHQHGPLLLPKIRSQDQERPLDLDLDLVNAISWSAKAQICKKDFHPPPRVFSTSQLGYMENALNSAAGSATIDLTVGHTDMAAMGTTASVVAPIIVTPDLSTDLSMLTADDTQDLDLGIDPIAFQSRSLGFPSMSEYKFPSAQSYSLHGGCTTTSEPSTRGHSPDYSIPSVSPPTTTLSSYLTAPNPAASLVRTLSFPLRDPHTKHFWWDVRQIRPWTDFTASTIRSLPGADTVLNYPIAQSLLPTPSSATRHPESEPSLHAIYANTYLPKLNAALALSSSNPLKLSAPSRPSANMSPNELVYTASAIHGPPSPEQLFGGKPRARVIGLVRAFDRFNTAQRVDGNIKRVEYLRGLAALHHAMREHGTRYGFIITEIELVVVRNGPETTPNFGFLEVVSVPLNAAASQNRPKTADGKTVNNDTAASASASTSASASGASVDTDKLSACLALWGLCMLAGDEPMPGHAHWKSDIGAPAEGTRRKALARDSWMPPPQLAEKREAKRARGWVLPEDPVGRKELGKRGVKYGGC